MELLEIKDSLHAFIGRTFLSPIRDIPDQLGPARITALCYALGKTSDLLMVMLLAMEIREMEAVPAPTGEHEDILAIGIYDIQLTTLEHINKITELMQR